MTSSHKTPSRNFGSIPEDLVNRIFSLLDGKSLANSREVCHKWNYLASAELIWKALCLERFKSLERDEDLWRLIAPRIPHDAQNRWRKVYPIVRRFSQVKAIVKNSGTYVCSAISHQISSSTPDTLERLTEGRTLDLDISRHINIHSLQTFARHRKALLYFEPEREIGWFFDFIDCLRSHARAGLVQGNGHRIILVPPSEYTRRQLGYQGSGLLGIVLDS